MKTKDSFYTEDEIGEIYLYYKLYYDEYKILLRYRRALTKEEISSIAKKFIAARQALKRLPKKSKQAVIK